jgi:hypothetical protein
MAAPALLPPDAICPLTLELMEDPVVVADGHSYERRAIEAWFARGHRRSPRTNLPLPHPVLVPNHALRGLIAELVARGATTSTRSTQGDWEARIPKIEQEAWPDNAPVQAEWGLDPAFVRTITSLLNKITAEKFEDISAKIVDHIVYSVHVTHVTQRIFHSATQQHLYGPLYADLCGALQETLDANPPFPTASNNFRAALQTQAANSLRDALDREVEHDLISKSVLVGAFRFIGCLLARRLLPLTVLRDSTEGLLADSSPLAVELLLALLATVGPALDTDIWWQSSIRGSCRQHLDEVFARARELAYTERGVPPRLRFLIRNLLDTRASRWVPRCAPEAPVKLNEIRVRCGLLA